MKSIGNDIVDLNLIDKERTRSPNFHSKFLCFKEKKEPFFPIFAQLPFEVYVWLLWTAKEAIYKFAKRLQPGLIFSPVKIMLGSVLPELSESEFSESQKFQKSIRLSKSGPFSNTENSAPIFLHFTHYNKNYYTRSVITSDYIVTVANNIPDFKGFETGLTKIAQTDHASQSARVRSFMLTRLQTLYPNQNFAIEKSEVGYPVVMPAQTDPEIIASFAHHGNYVAYAFRDK